MARPPTFDTFPSLTAEAPPSFDSFPSRNGGSKRRRQSRSLSRGPDGREAKEGRKEHKERKRKEEHDAKSGKSEKRKDKGKRREESQDEASMFLRGIEEDVGFASREDERKSRKDKHEKRRRRTPSPTTPAPPPTFAEPVYASSTNVREKKLFVVDLKDDTFNLRAGKPERGKVPYFRRTGAGRILGLHQNMRIALESAYTGNGLHISPYGRHRSAQLGDAASAALLNDRNLKRIALQPRRLAISNDDADDRRVADMAFIPLFDSALSIEAKGKAPESQREASSLLYPEASSSDAPSSDEDGDTAEPPDEEGGESVFDALNRRKAELEARTRQDPTDVSAWLACVKLQDELKASGLATLRSSGTRKSTAFRGHTIEGFDVENEAARRQVRGTAELQVAYLERALGVEANKGNLDLIKAYLKAYSSKPDVDFGQIDRKWRGMLAKGTLTRGRGAAKGKETVKEEEGRMSLWVDYISWRMSDGSTFKVDEIVQLVEEGMDSIRRDIEGESWTSPKRAAGEQTMLYLFHRCCAMLRQAGYAERSLAASQALVELNFFPPFKHAWSQLNEGSSSEDNSAAGNELIEDFEMFWDGEAPRIGESGAKGWGSTPPDAEPPPEDTANDADAAATTLADADLPAALDAWQVAEQTTVLRRLKPARTTDISVDADPYRVVVFDDLRNLLFTICTPEVRQQLVYSFLSLCGLQLAPPDISTDSPFFTDPFLSADIVDSPEAKRKLWRADDADVRKRLIIAADGHAPELISGIRRPFASPFKAFPVSVQSLFAAPDRWFLPFDQADLNACVDVDFVRHCFELLRPNLKSNAYFALCALSFECRIDPAAAAKMSKSWLAEDSSNIRLWDAHARIARLRGRSAEARNLYVTALSMSDSLNLKARDDLPLLWAGWAEMEVTQGNAHMALGVLTGMAGASESDPKGVASAKTRPAGAILLRARKAFSQRLFSAFRPNAASDIVRHRVEYTAASATLEYLSRGLDEACEVFEHSLKLLDYLQAPVEEEALWLEYSRLLYHHIGVSGAAYRPTKIREILRRAVERFPQNSAFLSLFAFNEARMRIQNETRRLIDSALLKFDVVTPNAWLFAIWVELHLNAATFNPVAVRDLFERGIANERTTFSAQLWCLYIEFETRQGEAERARRIVARAMATCPWSKDAYLFAFSRAVLESGASSPHADLGRISRVMGEKNLRLTREVQPILDKVLADTDRADSEDEVEALDRLDRQNARIILL